jgi:WD40 repeat protein
MVDISREQPFPGLRPFGFADHAFFFGRDQQIGELRRKLTRNRFIAVVGSSGCGKSSLVKAGLLPLLAQEHDRQQDEAAWLFLEMRPQGRPLRELARAVVSLKRRLLKTPEHIPRELQINRSEAALRRSSAGLIELLRELHEHQSAPLLLVVDQFEELFRFTRRRLDSDELDEADEAAAFVALLLRAGQAERPAIHVLLTMRSDFLGDCARFRGLPEAINDSQFLVPRLSRDQRRQVIEQPVLKAGAGIEPALLQRLLNDVGDDPDQLPVLQHALMRTWQHAGRRWAQAQAQSQPAHDAGERTMILDDYAAIGEMAGALSRHADAVFEALPGAHERLCAEQIFKALTDLDREGRAIRRTPPPRLQELVALTGSAEAAVSAVIDAFRAPDCCFLMPPADIALEPRTPIDISHEALIRRWRKLSGGRHDEGWLQEESRDGKTYTALLDAADSYARDREVVLAPALARQRLQWWNPQQHNAAWAQRYGGRFDSVSRLLAASRENLRREKSKRFWMWALALMAGVTTGLALLFYGFGQQQLELRREADQAREEARQAEKTARDRLMQLQKEIAAREQAEQERRNAQSMAAEAAQQAAQATWGASLERSRRLAAQSLELSNSGDAVTGLALALQVLENHNRELPYVAEAEQAAYTALRNLREIKILIRHDKPLLQAAWVSDVASGDTIRTLDSDGQSLLWNAADGTLLGPADAAPAQISLQRPLALSPDGRHFALISGEAAQLWDAAGNELITELSEGKGEQLRWLEFSPDSRSLLAVGSDIVRLWDVAGGRLNMVLGGLGGEVMATAFSPDSRYLAIAAGDHVSLWEMTSGQRFTVLAGHSDIVTSVGFAADGQRMITASLDATVRLWSLRPRLQTITLYGGSLLSGERSVYRDAVAHAAQLDFSSNGAFIGRSLPGGYIALWRRSDDNLLLERRLEVEPAALCTGINTLSVLGSDGQLYGLPADPTSTAPASRFDAPLAAVFGNHCDWLAMYTSDQTLSLFSTQRSSDPLSRVALTHDHAFTALQLALSDDDEQVLAATAEGAVFRYEVGGPGPIDVLSYANRYGRIMALHADSGLIASELITRGGARLLVWRGADGGDVVELPVPAAEGNLISAAFSPDGQRLLVVAENGPIRLWDLQSALSGADPSARATAPISILGQSSDRFVAVAYSPKGTQIAAARADGSVRVWLLFANTADCIRYARDALPRELSDAQLCQFGLLSEAECQQSTAELKAF